MIAVFTVVFSVLAIALSMQASRDLRSLRRSRERYLRRKQETDRMIRNGYEAAPEWWKQWQE
jgi:hypothetical protein